MKDTIEELSREQTAIGLRRATRTSYSYENASTVKVTSEAGGVHLYVGPDKPGGIHGGNSYDLTPAEARFVAGRLNTLADEAEANRSAAA